MYISICTTKCSNCGATLLYESKKPHFYCSYCRHKLDISDQENQRNILAEAKPLSTIDNEIKAKKRRLELISKDIENIHNKYRQLVELLIVPTCIGGIILFLGIISHLHFLFLVGIAVLIPSLITCIICHNQDVTLNTSAIVASYGEKIYLPEAVRHGVWDRLSNIKRILTKSGFTNIKTTPIPCLGILVEEEQVESIKIGEYDIKDFPRIRIDSDTEIEVNYYSQKTRINIEIKL